MNEFRALLGRRLRERGAKTRLGEATGIDPSLIGRWADPVADIRPSPKNLERLAPALGVPYSSLMQMCDYLPGESAESTDPQLSLVTAAWPRLTPSIREAMVALANSALFRANSSHLRDDTVDYIYQRGFVPAMG